MDSKLEIVVHGDRGVLERVAQLIADKLTDLSDLEDSEMYDGVEGFGITLDGEQLL